MMARTDWDLVMGKEGREELLRFQLQMIGVRVKMGWGNREVRKALKDLGLHFNPEGHSMTWAMVDVQEWCKLLGGRLEVSYPGVPVPDPDEVDQFSAVLRVLYSDDEFQRWFAVRYLAAARVKAGVSAKDFAAKIGATIGAVTAWESSTDSPLIPALMRHARGLGGIVRLDFVPVEQVKGPAGRK